MLLTRTTLSKKFNQTGSASAVLLLVSVFVYGLMLQLGGYNRVSLGRTITQNARMTAARDSIVAQIRQSASTPGVVRASLNPSFGSINSSLQHCVVGPICIADGVTPLSLTLYGVGSGTTIAGTALSPALYDLDGNRCSANVTAATKQCPFEATVSFVSTCPAGAYPCVNQTFQISYNVQISNSLPPGSVTTSALAPASGKADILGLNQILPQPAGYRPNLVVTSLLTPNSTSTTTTSPSSVDPAILAGIEAALATIGLTSSTIATTLVQAGITDPAMALDLMKDITNTNCQNQITLEGLQAIASVWLRNNNIADGIISMNQCTLSSSSTILAIEQAVQGVSNPILANVLAMEGVSDPSVARGIGILKPTARRVIGVTNLEFEDGGAVVR